MTTTTGATTDGGTTGGHSARQIGRSIGLSTTSNIVLKFGNLGVGVLIAHLVAPAEFGTFAVAMTVWTVLQTVAELGLGSDLVRATDLERRVPTVTTVGLVVSGALGAAMLLAARPLALAFDSPASTGPIRLMAVSMFLFGLTIVPSARLVRELRQGSMMIVNLIALVASTTAVVSVVGIGGGPLSLAVGQIVSQLVSVVGLHVAARHRVRLGFDRQIARESASFCLPVAGANLLSWVLISVDNLIVARSLDPLRLGFYVLAFNVSSWPMSAIGASIRVVALPVFARLPDGVGRARALTRISGPVLAVSLAAGIGLGTMSGPLVHLIYGGRWAPATPVLTALAAFGVLRVLFDLFATYLVAHGATRAVLLVQVVWLLVIVPGIAVGVRFFGLPGAGWAHLALAATVVLPAYLIALRRAGVTSGPMVRSLLLPLGLAIPIAVLTRLAVVSLHHDVVALVTGSAIIVVGYLLPLSRWCLHRLRPTESGPTGTGRLPTPALVPATAPVLDPGRDPALFSEPKGQVS